MFTLSSDRLPHLLIGVVIYFAAIQIFSLVTRSERRKLALAFFHPYCDGGGGGERVLWAIIRGLLTPSVHSRENPNVTCSVVEKYHAEIVIYSGELHRTKEEILANVEKKFGIVLTEKQRASIRFVNIHTRFLLEAKWYPVATMICQSLGSILVGFECAIRHHPDIFIDTMGAAFTYPFIRSLYSSKIIAYVHYPIISSDMLKKVREQRPSYNNAGRIAQSVTVSSLKLLYYRAFAYGYQLCGYFADEVMVNSTWTKNHIEELWLLRPEDRQKARESPLWFPRQLMLLYPPCNTTAIQAKFSPSSVHSDDETPLSEDDPRRLLDQHRVIMSLGQFRPEKDHMLQVRAMEAFIQKTSQSNDEGDDFSDVILVMLGSTRNAEDNALADGLQAYIDSKPALHNRVHLLRNLPYARVEEFLRRSSIGLHTMWNEHFGISVVEMVAAGLITVAHNSGGPKADIIQPGINGFLASESDEYAELFEKILSPRHQGEMDAIRAQARASAEAYSDELFEERVVHEIDHIVKEVF